MCIFSMIYTERHLYLKFDRVFGVWSDLKHCCCSVDIWCVIKSGIWLKSEKNADKRGIETVLDVIFVEKKKS